MCVLIGGLTSHLECCSLKEEQEFDGISLLNIMRVPHLDVEIGVANCFTFTAGLLLALLMGCFEALEIKIFHY